MGMVWGGGGGQSVKLTTHFHPILTLRTFGTPFAPCLKGVLDMLKDLILRTILISL